MTARDQAQSSGVWTCPRCGGPTRAATAPDCADGHPRVRMVPETAASYRNVTPDRRELYDRLRALRDIAEDRRRRLDDRLAALRELAEEPFPPMTRRSAQDALDRLDDRGRAHEIIRRSAQDALDRLDPDPKGTR